MYQINEDVIMIKGFKNGAIYDLKGEKVYAINEEACDIIMRYMNHSVKKSDLEYIDLLKNARLISGSFEPEKFDGFEKNEEMKLEIAWLEITQTCNMRCIHCYEGSVHESDTKVLDIEDWKCVIDQLAARKIKRIIIIGGEPCCHKNVCDIISYASNYNIDIILFTNASMIDENIFNCIIKNKIRVKISVYGHCPEIHERITRVPGSFEKLRNTVVKLVDNNIYVESAIIIMEENQNYLDDIVAFVKGIGMNYSRYDVIRQVYGGTQNEHVPTNSDLINRVSLTKPNFHITKKKFENSLYRNTCWYGKIVIMENGNVIPCEFERSIIYGNILKESLDEILEKEETKDKWFMDYSKIEECCDCEFRFACKDCRPLGFGVGGNIYAKNPRCCYDVYNGKWVEKEWIVEKFDVSRQSV